jgi:hypothetical protein
MDLPSSCIAFHLIVRWTRERWAQLENACPYSDSRCSTFTLRNQIDASAIFKLHPPIILRGRWVTWLSAFSATRSPAREESRNSPCSHDCFARNLEHFPLSPESCQIVFLIRNKLLRSHTTRWESETRHQYPVGYWLPGLNDAVAAKTARSAPLRVARSGNCRVIGDQSVQRPEGVKPRHEPG